MDQMLLVEGHLKDGQKLLDRLAEEGVPVLAAGWVKETNRWQWYLYLVTPLVGEGGDTLPAYRRVGAVVDSMPQPFWIDSAEIKVVGPWEKVGKAILALRPRATNRVPTQYGGTTLGDVSIDGAFFYPPPPTP